MIGSNRVIGIDCSEEIWRIVALRMAGARCEVHYARSISPEERVGEDKATALAALLREAGGAAARIAVSLPTSGCTFKTASLPPGKLSEIEQVIRFEAENQFPLPLPELIWGYSLTPEPDGRRHAVIVGARRSLIEDLLDLCRRAGATPAMVLPAAMAAMQTVPQGNGICAQVYIGAEESDLCLFAGDKLLSCRSVAVGNPASAGWAEKIARELRPWIVTHDGLPRIVLLGLASEKLATLLSQATAGIPVFVSNPWLAIVDPQSLLPALEDSPAAFATAVGLAKSALTGRAAINLLPNEFNEAARQKRNMSWTLLALGSAIVIAFYLAFTGHIALGVLQQNVASLEIQINKAKKQIVAAPSPAVIAAGQVVHSMQALDGRPLELMTILSQKLPAGVTLTDFTFVREKTIVLQGHAVSNSQVVDALSALDATRLFDDVMLNYSNQVSSPNTMQHLGQGNSAALQGIAAQGYDFQITCSLPAGSDVTLGNGKQSRKSKGAENP